ncbi:ABC transporter substrate-binding protein [Desulfotomaculum sp. 1211_IL3151]|uniref:ABC transporter substrate-binding protein n=1 Tax=Desulfotomaculum sp. 1211_IL3151 TaxID=3084055 RepID=UPI002FD9BC73
MLMKSKKAFTSVILSVSMLFILSGCGSQPLSETTASNISLNSQIDIQPEQTAKTVVDDLGRSVVIPSKPQRVLALNSARMEDLFNLGITPVGKVDEYKIRQEGIDLPSAGSVSNINLETIYQLKPDLIIAHSRHHGIIVEALEETGCPVYYFDPVVDKDASEDDVIMFLADLLGKKRESENYLNHINSFAKEYKEKIAAQTDIKTAVIIMDGDTITAAQTASGFGTVLTVLGLANIVPEGLPGSSTSTFVAFDIETILDKNPDVVLVMAASNNKEDNQRLLDKYLNDSKWASLDAVRENKLTILPFKANPNRATREQMIQLTAEAILSAAK